MEVYEHWGGVASRFAGRLDRRCLLSVAASAGVAAVVSGVGLPAVSVPAVAKEVTTCFPAAALVSVPAGVLSVQQRQAVVTGVTKVLAEVARAGPDRMPFISVLVVGVADGGWGVAGHGYVRSELPELAAGRPLPPGAAPVGGR